MESIRINTVKLFMARLESCELPIDQKKILELARELEAAFINKSIASTQSSTLSYHENPICINHYCQSTNEILTNMELPCIAFYPRLISGEILPADVPNLDPSVFNPVPMQHYIEKSKKRENVELVLKTNDNYRCLNCNKACVVRPAQLGRGDEQSSTVTGCPHCGKIKIY